MNLLPPTHCLQDFPIAIASIDSDFQIKNYSDLWIKEFPFADVHSPQDYHFNSIHTIPNDIKEIVRNIIQNQLPDIENLELKNYKKDWFHWKIKGIKNEDNLISSVLIIAEKITEKKRNEALLEKAVQVSKVGGWEVNLISNTVYWTDVTKSIHELPLSYSPNIEQGIKFYKLGRDRELITKLLHEAIHQGIPWDQEFLIITAKGNDKWVRSKGEVEIIDKRIVRIYGTFQDIDEEKKIELRSKEIAERLKIATKASKIGIWDYDIINNTIVWDKNMYKLYGIKEKDFKGVYSAWEATVYPDDKEQCHKEIQLAINGIKEFDTEFRVVYPSGEIRTIKAVAHTAFDATGKAIKMIGTNWDITELKNIKLDLIKSEKSLQGTFENSSIGMALVALDGQFTRVNDSLCKSVGYSREELLQLTFKDITYPDDLDKDLKMYQQVIDYNIESYQLEKRYLHKEGHLVYTILTVTAVKLSTNELSHFISQIVDITPRIEAKNKLQALVDVTVSQNESLLNFAHIVSHNLRSHSTNLSMLTSFLVDEKIESEKEHISQMLHGAAESLTETVDHLNEVVQITTNSKDKLRDINLYDAVQAVKKNISALLIEKEAICTISIPKNTTIKVFPAYLDSILLNLFTNSVKYSSPNRPLKIDLSSKIQDHKVRLDFTDNGQGIDLKRHSKKLFGMYKTFHDHKDAKGIGLFITKNQIEAMNGSIDVQSEVAKGTTFMLTFESAVDNSFKTPPNL